MAAGRVRHRDSALFRAPAEPSLIAATAALGFLVIAAWLSREHATAFVISLGLAFLAAGFAVSTLRSALVAHPVLTRKPGPVTLQGFVESRDTTERSDRIVLRVTSAIVRGRQTMPDRVRVALRRGTAPAVGAHIELRARLRPLLGPVRLGGYDYACGAYYQGLGATGFVLGRPVEKPAAVPLLAVAVRGADGNLTIQGANRGRLAALSWLAAEADGRTTKDELATGFICDVNGCVARLTDGSIIAVALKPEAFADDCRDAALVVSKSQLPEACAAPGIDRRTLSTTGAISLRRVDGKWVAETARSPYADRPWFGRPAPPDPKVLERLTPRQPATPAPSIIERPRPGDVPVPDVPEGEIVEE